MGSTKSYLALKRHQISCHKRMSVAPWVRLAFGIDRRIVLSRVEVVLIWEKRARWD